MIFIPCAGTDITTLSKELDLDNEPFTRDEYADIIANINGIKDTARQLRNSQHKTQSLYNSVKNFAEAACSHRHKVFFVSGGNKKRKKKVEREALDVERFMDSVQTHTAFTQNGSRLHVITELLTGVGISHAYP